MNFMNKIGGDKNIIKLFQNITKDLKVKIFFIKKMH